jgi:chemotaxis protein MotA
MFVIIGVIVVILGVVGGYLLEHGPLHVLWQPAELVIIGGAALGSLLISAPLKLLMKLLKELPKVFAGSKYNSATYTEALLMQYEVYLNAKKSGLMALEADVNDPHNSSIFSKYPRILKDHHAMEFFSDALRILINGAAKPDELETALEIELETHHDEGAKIPSMITKVADSLPGLGIVAAVLGIVITVQAIDGPPEEIGHKVGAALVGTFLGILASYGFLSPLATNIENIAADEAKFFLCLKVGILAFANGAAPLTAIEFARKVIYSYDRPSGAEIEQKAREIKPR